MKKIALIFGGPSPEHDVSLVSAKNIYQALKETSLNILLLGVTRSREWKLIKPEDLESTSFENPLDISETGIGVEFIQEDDQVFVTCAKENEKLGPIDVAFPIIHGPFGEDGELQKILDDLSLKYVGSNYESCLLSIDKALTKEAIQKTSILQVPYIVCEDSNPEYKDVVEKLGTPFFIKPARMGSSIGIHKVSNEETYHKAIADARVHDSKLVIEKGLEVREIECAVLENKDKTDVTAPSEIVTSHDFYSYEAKYLDPNGAEFIIPAQLDDALSEKLKVMAKEAFTTLKCKDYARVDFFLTKDNHIYFNELNTHPGFTSISQFPQLWMHEGMSYKELILHLLNQALQN